MQDTMMQGHPDSFLSHILTALWLLQNWHELAQAPMYQLCATQEKEPGKMGSSPDHSTARDSGCTVHIQKLH